MRRALLLTCLLLLCCPNAPAQRGETHAAKRARLLRDLRKCRYPSGEPGCSEDYVDPVARLYERGDAGVLANLMDVAPHSDGALSESLGAFFSTLLCRRPETFLRAVSARPRREHDNLLFLAAAGDGSGMSCRTIPALRRGLKRLARGPDRRLAAVAAKSLEQVNKYNPGR